VENVLANRKVLTPDMGGENKTTDMGDAVCREI
jgi:isocitrate/isopropylmalate dehydrogenase